MPPASLSAAIRGIVSRIYPQMQSPMCERCVKSSIARNAPRASSQRRCKLCRHCVPLAAIGLPATVVSRLEPVARTSAVRIALARTPHTSHVVVKKRGRAGGDWRRRGQRTGPLERAGQCKRCWQVLAQLSSHLRRRHRAALLMTAAGTFCPPLRAIRVDPSESFDRSSASDISSSFFHGDNAHAQEAQ